MKLTLILISLFISVVASAKNLQCLPDGTADGSFVAMFNVENIEKSREFPARFKPANQEVIYLANCGNPRDLPTVYCFFRTPPPGPTYFLKFETLNPRASENKATLQLQVYGRNNQVLRSYSCK